MTVKKEWELDSSVKERLISALAPELATLRTKADISQGDLANIIGVSRQTYNAIECGSRKMLWNVYLALILYYDYNQKTHQMIRALGVFPQELMARINETDVEEVTVSSFLPEGTQGIVDKLDDQALQAIRTMIMVEYGRCTGLSGEAVVRSFDGMIFSRSSVTGADVTAKKAISAIKGRQKNAKQQS